MQEQGQVAPKRSSGAFDGLRLAAALSVLFGHCFVLTGRGEEEPLSRLTHGGVGFGNGAVFVFFAISGYLVTQSWLRDPSVRRFLVRRLLRIIPGLAFVIIASALVIGALITPLGLSDYFSRRETWTYLTNILLYPTQYGLPDVFESNPYPAVINGSLWTLRLEFSLYIIIALLGVSGFLRKRWLSLFLAALCLTAVVALNQTDVPGHIPFLHQVAVLFTNAVPFFVGAALAQFNLVSKRLWGITAFLAVLTALFVATPAFQPLLLVSLPLVTILIARFGFCNLKRIGDLSYGVYLWSFVTQQVVINRIEGITPTGLFLTAGTAALIMAGLSWHLIEKRALQLKPHAHRGMTGEVPSSVHTFVPCADLTGSPRRP